MQAGAHRRRGRRMGTPRRGRGEQGRPLRTLRALATDGRRRRIGPSRTHGRGRRPIAGVIAAGGRRHLGRRRRRRRRAQQHVRCQGRHCGSSGSSAGRRGKHRAGTAPRGRQGGQKRAAATSSREGRDRRGRGLRQARRRAGQRRRRTARRGGRGDLCHGAVPLPAAAAAAAAAGALVVRQVAKLARGPIAASALHEEATLAASACNVQGGPDRRQVLPDLRSLRR
mmetsp:Transcript_123269/g.356153  ORF Transcript_123269/g.356153 Transcript_123269/m.356153 type:complete len:226 (+) Transcript_123269:430-1107(+)